MNLHEYLNKTSESDDTETVIRAYRLYNDQMKAVGIEPLLSITRAWRLTKFMDTRMLTMTRCTDCGGRFVTDIYENQRHFCCGLCNPPARAGRGQAAGSLRVH